MTIDEFSTVDIEDVDLISQAVQASICNAHNDAQICILLDMLVNLNWEAFSITILAISGVLLRIILLLSYQLFILSCSFEQLLFPSLSCFSQFLFPLFCF